MPNTATSKEIIRPVSIREAALEEVARVAENAPECEQVAAQIRESAPTRRSVLDRLATMSRGVQGINLNTGQDFDGSLQELIGVVGSEIQWDLLNAVPFLRTGVGQSGGSEQFRSAEDLAKHRLRDFPIALGRRIARGEQQRS